MHPVSVLKLFTHPAVPPEIIATFPTNLPSDMMLNYPDDTVLYKTMGYN